MHAKAVSLRTLFIRSTVLLLLLAAGFTVAFLALAGYQGSLNLPDFLMRQPGSASESSLAISVIPEGASITINQRPYNPLSLLDPGEYVIGVSADGYYPAEENVHVQPDGNSSITIRLIPIPSTLTISDDAAAPGWDRQNDLFFLNRSQGKIQQWSGNALSTGVDVQGQIYQVLYQPDGLQAVVFAGAGADAGDVLYRVNLQEGGVTDLPVTGSAAIGQDGNTIWGIYEDPGSDPDKPAWKLPPGGSPIPIPLDNPQEVTNGAHILIDPTGQWLATEGGRGIAVWDIASGRMVATFPDASAPVWIQNPKPGLGYLTSDANLSFARADLNWSSEMLLSNIQAPIAGMPGGSEIVFSRYNPFAGGASFWAVDTSTASLRLLSEASTESGRAAQLAISYDQKEIAFVNDRSVLFLVRLEP
jgi:hypothetical protein